MRIRAPHDCLCVSFAPSLFGLVPLFCLSPRLSPVALVFVRGFWCARVVCDRSRSAPLLAFLRVVCFRGCDFGRFAHICLPLRVLVLAFVSVQFVRQLLADPHYGLVVGTALDEADGRELSSLPDVRVLFLNITDDASVDRFATAVKAAAPHVDLLVICCGLLNGGETGMTDFTAAGMMREYAINTVGPLGVVRALVLRGALGGPAGSSTIAVTTSVLGSTGLVRSVGRARSLSWGFYGYRASKAAMNMLVVLLAAELETRGIIVCALHPGYVLTKMTASLLEGGRVAAEIDAADSVKGMLRVITRGSEIQGAFLTWEGAELPW